MNLHFYCVTYRTGPIEIMNASILWYWKQFNDVNVSVSCGILLWCR